jgi:perosamine synthetase
MNLTLDNFLVSKSATLKDALNCININCKGICFVIDESQKLIGTLTDGDIRRALLAEAQLDDKIVGFMHQNYIKLHISTEIQDILSQLNDKIKVIPLIDDDDNVVDYATINKIRRIPVANPVLNGNELNYVNQCIKTAWISSQGKFVRQFEDLFSELVGQQHALAVSNGTVALHLALAALGIGKGDEVIVPDLTFAATINAVLYVGATPVLSDIDPLTLGLSLDTVRPLITEKTKAIIPVHLYGMPCDVMPIVMMARERNIYIIEDCAEAVGSKYYDKHVGYHADASTFSFFGNKTITTGEGGMVVFKDNKIADHARILRDHGMSKIRRYWHDHIGYNFRLTNLQAAIGVAQLERVGDIVKKKRSIAESYTKYLKDVPGLILPADTDWSYNTYWLYTFLVEGISEDKRDRIIRKLSNKGIETRPVFYPLHIMSPYSEYGNSANFPIASKAAACGISLPSSIDLDEESIFRVSNEVIQILDEFVG